MDDLISRQAAIDALWKALHEYEDKTEKKFQESEDLDIQDWIQHRIFVIFVQNMSDIDRQTILNLPSADRPQGWADKAISIIDAMQKEGIIDYEQAWEFRMRARMKGADDE